MAKSVLKWDEFGPIEARSYQAITDHLPGGRSQFIIQKVFKTYALRDFGITSTRWINHGSFKTPASAKKYARELLENYPVMKANPAPKSKANQDVFTRANQLIKEGYERKQAFAIAYRERDADLAHLFGKPKAKRNPVKRKTAARTQRAAEGYVYRDSQVTKKKPTKRLVTRRAKNLQAPRGVFPNPKKRDPTYWVITLHDGYLSYRSDSGYTGSEPYLILDGNTGRQKAMSFIRKIGLKRGQYEILKDNPGVHFDIDVNSHNARGSKAKTRVNPVYRVKAPAGKEKFIRVELKYGNEWEILSLFPKTGEGAENAIMYAKAYHVKEPKATIRVME